MATAYERALITELTYIPIDSKIIDVCNDGKTIEFKITNNQGIRSIAIEMKGPETKCSTVKHAIINVLVWLGIPILTVGLMVALPFMYLYKLYKTSKNQKKNVFDKSIVIITENETLNKFEHNGTTTDPLYVLIELANIKTGELTKIIRFEVPT
jgi:hypothetical protein